MCVCVCVCEYIYIYIYIYRHAGRGPGHQRPVNVSSLIPPQSADWVKAIGFVGDTRTRPNDQPAGTPQQVRVSDSNYVC
jgi:hypothetical protein